jgi:glycosyltransferase involved in cell wall biosynthesis
VKLLLELRPALGGHAGIPQETRLLFRGLSSLRGVEVEGLIQSSSRVLSKGLPARARRRVREDRKMNRLSKVLVSLHEGPRATTIGRALAAMKLVTAPISMLGGTLLGLRQSLTRFEPTHFQDFVWRTLFERTLPIEDFATTVSAGYRVAQMPWTLMHAMGLGTQRLGHALYPKLDTRGFDVMIAETPYPGRVAAPTRLVIRYHDAIPLLMPHTISDKAYHQASHFHALRRNVRDGAWFACVSESTRKDLLSIFPEVGDRAVTIHNMVSHHYFREESSAELVPEILRTRRHPKAPGAHGGAGQARKRPVQYLLMVSTIEPRKNHLSLISAWERLKTQGHDDLELVFVSSIGWDEAPILAKMRPWLERGGLHWLEDVPAEELRVLYRHARVTICPSFGEGFDYSGVEAMRCGGVVAASEIPVHRDVFATAAEYFSPYSVTDMVNVIARLLEPGAEARRTHLIEEGDRVSSSYLPQTVLPQWQDFLARLTRIPSQS